MKRNIGLSFLLFLSVCSASCILYGEGSEKYISNRGDYCRTGEYPGPAPELREMVWSCRENVARKHCTAIFDGKIFTGNKNFYSFDAKTGKILWQFTPNGTVSGAPAIANGTVYFSTIGNESPTVYALDIETGKQLWSITPTDNDDKKSRNRNKNQSNLFGFTPMLTDSKTIYFGFGYKDNKFFYALDARDGREKWRVKLEKSCADDNSILYRDFISHYQNARRVFIDTATGKNLRKYKFNFYQMAVVKDSVVGFDFSEIFLADASGRKKWGFKYQPQAFGDQRQLTVANGVVCFASHELLALDLGTGKKIWDIKLGPVNKETHPIVEPTAAAGGVFYFGNGTYKADSPSSGSSDYPTVIRALDIKTGREISNFTFPSWVHELMIADGILYAIGQSGEIYAVK